LDLGDKYSYLCLIAQEDGEVMEEGRLRTTPEALKRRFASERPPMRIAIEAASCKYAPRFRHLRLHTSMEKGVSHKVACTSLIHQSADHLMWKIFAIRGVSKSMCGANAWYAQTCIQALPVRNVKNVLIMPGPKYCKSRKQTKGHE
jgi:hypothetical protein